MPLCCAAIGPKTHPMNDSPSYSTANASTAQTAWIFSDGKKGHETLTESVATELGVNTIKKIVPASGLWRLAAPWGPVSRKEQGKDAILHEPWPALALAAGRTTIPYLRALKVRARSATLTVAMMDPKTGLTTADLIWVPEHDKLRGANVVTTLTSPNNFSQSALAKLRADLPQNIQSLAGRRVAVMLGGPTKSHRFSESVVANLLDGIRSFVARGASLMITPSRRTPSSLLDAVREATSGAPNFIWDGTDANPYAYFVAVADAFVVTGDSVNMIGEAASTGRPIYVCQPEGGTAKFQRFHARLESIGATRNLSVMTAVETEQPFNWSYEPIATAPIIAEEITRRLRMRSAH